MSTIMSSSNEQTYRSLEDAVQILQDLAENQTSNRKQYDFLANIAEDLNDIIVYAQLRDD